MTFAQWYAMPRSEQRHRRLLYLADVERQIEASDQNAPWEDDPDWSRDS